MKTPTEAGGAAAEAAAKPVAAPAGNSNNNRNLDKIPELPKKTPPAFLPLPVTTQFVTYTIKKNDAVWTRGAAPLNKHGYEKEYEMY